MLRVVTWNLFHGRSVPPAGRPLAAEFAAALASWSWDVALLQEVPPWWPPALAAASGAQQRTALTSRNQLLPLRRAIAQWRPELIKSGGGGANAILVRGAITAHAKRRLVLSPERRVVHAVRDGHGRWFANLHATVHDDPQARREIAVARATALRWADGAPLAIGGDFNVRDPQLPGFAPAGSRNVDHVFACCGLTPGGDADFPKRGLLSDHAPVIVTLRSA